MAASFSTPARATPLRAVRGGRDRLGRVGSRPRDQRLVRSSTISQPKLAQRFTISRAVARSFRAQLDGDHAALLLRPEEEEVEVDAGGKGRYSPGNRSAAASRTGSRARSARRAASGASRAGSAPVGSRAARSSRTWRLRSQPDSRRRGTETTGARARSRARRPKRPWQGPAKGSLARRPARPSATARDRNGRPDGDHLVRASSSSACRPATKSASASTARAR